MATSARLGIAVVVGAIASITVPLRSEVTAPTAEERLQRAEAMLSQESLHQRQKAFDILARLGTPGAEKLLLAQFDRLEKGDLPLPLWLDLLEAAQRHGSPLLQQRLAARADRLASAKDAVVRWRECLEGGDAESGREIFTQKPEAGCVRCHSVNGHGGTIGPELAGLGLRSDRVSILESILVPDANIVFGYGNVLLTLKDGEIVNGLLNVETRDQATLISLVDGQRRQIKTRNILSRTALPSAMPPIFGQALSKRQIRDLVEFIATAEPQ
jgi:quinoprotein glucose dehydrogenase